MISAMLNGGRDSVQETTESSYNDVLGSVDAWANKYIEYCTARGIVSGVGGDRFAPASNVTGTQLAKMLLVSLGYDSVKEGYQTMPCGLSTSTPTLWLPACMQASRPLTCPLP